MKEEIEKILNSYKSISLKEIGSVSLLKRTDTKFVLHINDLNSILQELSEKYEVLEIDGKRILSYKSQYFDTSKKKFYHDHHNGKLNRMKVRIRKYVETDDTYLEIKQKNSKGILTKTRMPIENYKTDLNPSNKDFISKTTQKNYILESSIANSFERTTLANRVSKERVTIDINIKFKYKNQIKEYKNVAIIELKQARLNRNSDLFQVLKKKQINPYRISKYCIGMASLISAVKHNNFKKKIIKLKKISKQHGIS